MSSSINVQVNRNNNIISVGINSTGPQGQSAYETWLALGNVGTRQDFINSQFDEPARVTNENARKQNENTRIENENNRVAAENLRVQAEQDRETEFDSIVQAYDNATKANTVIELTNARHDNINNKDYANIGARLDNTAEQINDLDADVKTQLAEKAPQTAVDNLTSGKVDKNGSGQVTWANAAQDFREQITGGNTAVVADDSVITSNLTNNAVTPPKSTFFTSGKNLFNKSTATSGTYVIYTSGETAGLSGYNVSDFIPVLPNSKYIQSTNEQFAFFDDTQTYLSGGSGGPAVNTPSNAYFVRVNVKDAALDTYQLESGDTLTPYEPYRYALKKDHASVDLNTYTVGKVNSDFALIKQAVAHALSNEPNKKITVEVRPGEYEERFNNIRGASNVSVIGKNKKDCILIDRTGDYYRSPIQLSGEFYLKNLTAIANNDDVETLPSLKSYAIHIDYDGEGTSLIEDCRFESYQNSAVGIGTRQGQTIVFKNCDFYTDTDYGATLYFHNAVGDDITSQKLIFDNCRILAKKGDALRVEDSNILYGTGSGTDLEVEFINCHFWSEEKGLDCYSVAPSPIGTGTLAGNIRLSPKSYGNNLPTLNA